MFSVFHCVLLCSLCFTVFWLCFVVLSWNIWTPEIFVPLELNQVCIHLKQNIYLEILASPLSDPRPLQHRAMPKYHQMLVRVPCSLHHFSARTGLYLDDSYSSLSNVMLYLDKSHAFQSGGMVVLFKLALPKEIPDW